MTASDWGGILQSGGAKELAGEFRKSLANRMTEEASDEALKLLYRLKEELLRELSTGKRIPEEIGKLIENLPKARVADELTSSMKSFIKLAAELYTTRSSVSSTFTLAQSFYDRLIATAFDHAVDQLEKERGKVPELQFALLVSGELGRVESFLGSRSSFFFFYKETGEEAREYINELAMRLMAILSLCFPSISRNLKSPSPFWYGSDSEWQETAAKMLKVAEPDNWSQTGANTFALMLETAADMRIVCGDSALGQSVLDAGRKLVAGYIQSETFRHFSKDIASMPVALGIFGRLKTVRSGKNKGKFDLKGMALDPLAAAARVLALSSGGSEPSFTGRIRSILAVGNIGVSLADRLLIVYQDFMRERIRLELSPTMQFDGFFFNPDELDEESKERFKAGLDDITTLQRLVHQQLVEVEQR